MERRRGIRMASVCKAEETVVDMFAGIGYFTLPIAKHAKPKEIHAIEKNPVAAGFLKENMRLNRVSCVEAIEGDNRNAPASMQGIADRVLMGYLPGTEKFLPAAFGFLKPSGGIIHFHNTYVESELWDEPARVIESEAKKAGYALQGIGHKAVVKKFAPGVYHAVVDCSFTSS